MIAGAALAVALLSQSAASEAGTAVRLEVRGAAGCTSRADLTARIKARSSRITVADDAGVSAEVAVVSQRPGAVAAELVLANAGAEQPPRRVVARSCAEVADAVALIIAVTLDPNLKPAPDVAPAPAPAARSEERPAPATTPPAPPVAVEPAAAPPPAAKRPIGTQLGAYLTGQAIVGPAPAVMPGIAIQVMAALDRDGPWAPALFVGATHVWRSELAEPGGQASFTLDAATLDACPLRLRWSRLAARPCASALIGRLEARGSDTAHAASSTRPFAAAGASVTAGFGSTVELFTRLGADVTVIRDSYELGASVFHRAAPITFSASLGIGTRWP
jgi:hypothetical protein